MTDRFGAAAYALITATLDALVDKKVIIQGEDLKIFQQASEMLKEQAKTLRLPAMKDGAQMLRKLHDEMVLQRGG